MSDRLRATAAERAETVRGHRLPTACGCMVAAVGVLLAAVGMGALAVSVGRWNADAPVHEAGGLVWLSETGIAWWTHEYLPHAKSDGTRLWVLDTVTEAVTPGGRLSGSEHPVRHGPSAIAYSIVERAFYVSWGDEVARLADGSCVADVVAIHPAAEPAERLLLAGGDGGVYLRGYGGVPSPASPAGAQHPECVARLSPDGRGLTWTYEWPGEVASVQALYSTGAELYAFVTVSEPSGEMGSVRRRTPDGGAEEVVRAPAAWTSISVCHALFLDEQQLAFECVGQGGDTTVRLWNWATGETRDSGTMHLGDCQTSELSPDATRLAVWPDRRGGVPTVYAVPWR